MGLFSNFFRSSESSSDVAKRRLKVAITSDRAVCSPELMEQMKRHYSGHFKYVDIDTEGLDIKVTKTELDETSGTVNALLANIPIKEGSRNFRK